jgi:CDGSH-type Zn-finger protein/uncharacterized Fe-S cluster protein YjdI
MKKRILTYEGEEIEVTWDKERCIHAGVCVRSLPAVFDTSRRRWVLPDNASSSEVADVIEQCPTGALHYEMKHEARQEAPPSRNRIKLQPNGPVYLFGDIEIEGPDGTTLLQDTRVALCRCGASANMPLCDNTHTKSGFKASRDADTESLPKTDASDGPIVVRLMKDGPVLINGCYTMEAASGSCTSDKSIALCRCGHSSNKPFCDGTHKQVGFSST